MAPTLSSRSTTLQALRGVDLTGRTALITGGNSGLGVETARAMAHAGAKVILTSRKVEAGQKIAQELQSSGVKGAVEVVQLDLADLSSIHQLAQQLNNGPALDFLFLNAGVMACPQSYTKNGFEMQVGTNHFGHFELTRSLMDKLKQQGTPVRIIAVTSSAHKMDGLDLDDLHFKKRKYTAWQAYGQSKLCNVLYAKELARRTQGSNVQAYAVHPGIILTGLWQHSPMLRPFLKLGSLFTKSPAQGAATAVYAATAPELEGKSGAYLQDCQVSKSSAQGADAELASKLWSVTEEQLAEARKGL
ncbi:hypothetical protein ABBQ38_012211 [Trebouxia sp. C0009 RCD-2024]